jgi:hypothetical protein
MNYIEKEFNAATEDELKFRERKSESDASPIQRKKICCSPAANQAVCSPSQKGG